MSVAERSLVRGGFGGAEGGSSDADFVVALAVLGSSAGWSARVEMRVARWFGCELAAESELLVLGEVEFGLVVFGAFDDGVDDVGLAACGYLFADEVPDFVGALFGHAAGDDGGAAGGELVDDAGFEVAVEGEGEGAGDGGGGHDEDVGVGGSRRWGRACA